MRMLGQVALRWPQAAFGAAAVADGVRNAVRRRRGDPPYAVQWDGPGRYRERVLAKRRLDPGTRWPYPPVKSSPEPGTVKGPLVLVTLHVGSTASLGALLERLDDEVLALRFGQRYIAGHIKESFIRDGDESTRVAALKEAVDVLRRGGIVCVAADNDDPEHARLRVADQRSTTLVRGPFAMARMTGAPMRPIAACWRGRSIEITLGPHVAADAEPEMAAAVLDWFDGYLERRPGIVGGKLGGK